MAHSMPGVQSRADPGPLSVVASVGLAVGGAFGMAGTFVRQAELRQAFWGLDGVALVTAAALLAVKFVRRGDDLLAAGFLVFAAGETLVLSGAPSGLEASVPSFGAGVALWSAALVLVSIPRTFAVWARLAGAAAAVLFAVTAGRIFWGEHLLPTAAPLPSLGYPFLVLAFVGWILKLLRPGKEA